VESGALSKYLPLQRVAAMKECRKVLLLYKKIADNCLPGVSLSMDKKQLWHLSRVRFFSFTHRLTEHTRVLLFCLCLGQPAKEACRQGSGGALLPAK
jgi:hypothetical protein